MNHFFQIFQPPSDRLPDCVPVRPGHSGGIQAGVIRAGFFTTKPTGQGTGLGLSLAYDIVKAHGGEIKVETKEAEGTVFIMQLPV
jgi:nitrogen-specific signal transduction histidine kinase